MKTVGPLCALAALAACSESESPTSKDKATASSAQTGWVLEPGTYEYARPDAAGLLVLAEDGAYTDVMSGGDLGTGRWRNEQRLSCLMPDGAPKRCYTFTAPNAGGRFTGTATDGSKMTARKLE